MKQNLKQISPLIMQMATRNLGMYCSSYLANDLYYLLESVNLLIPDIGEDFISEKYKEEGKDWNEIKKKLEKLTKLIIKVKVWYDPIEDKKFQRIAKKDPERKIQRFFIKTASKVALMQSELYNLFVFLVKNTSIQRNQIHTDAFKILEHTGFKKLDLTKKPISREPEIVDEG